MPRNTVWGYNRTVVKLESSEEKSFKQRWLNIENLFFTAVEMNSEPNSAWFTICKKWNKEGDSQRARSKLILRLISCGSNEKFVKQKNLLSKRCLLIHPIQNFTEQSDLAADCQSLMLPTLFFPLQRRDWHVWLTGVGDRQCKRFRKQGLTFCLFLWLLPTYTRSEENFSLHLNSGYSSCRCQRHGWGAPTMNSPL